MSELLDLPEGFTAAAPGNGGGDPERRQKQLEEARQRKEMTNTMLSHLLTQDARARLGRIGSVKREKAEMIESALIHLFQSGQIKPKVNEEMLISLIDQINDQNTKKTAKVVRRRVYTDDEEEEEEDDDDDEDDW
eukprot:CFRG7570T1